MPVVSLTERLEEYVRFYLDEAAPPGVEVVFTTGIHQRASECEHGDLTFETVLWLTVWINSDEPERQSYHKSGHIPAELILDGDMEPVHLLISEVWQRAFFGSIMSEVDEDLEAVAQSEDNGA